MKTGKSIFDYCVDEAKKETVPAGKEFYSANGEVVVGDPDKQAKKDAEDNDSEGIWEVEAPTDDDLMEDLDMEHADHNKRRIVMKLKTKRPFFIQGRAGWGKTTVITKLAKKFGRSVITVYLDKAEATDLGGIPVTVKEKDGSVSYRTAMPGWAAIMAKHPDRQYLLFFDELNHASNEVLRCLMPIVEKHVICGHKYDNYIVAAAGNLNTEEELEELPNALESRFKPIIQWETNTTATWNSAFKEMHKKWDSKVGEDLVNMVENVCILFENPREIEHNIIEFCYELVNAGDNEWMTVDDIKEQIEGLVAEEHEGISHYEGKTKEENINKLASYVHSYIQSGGKNAFAKPQGRMAKQSGASKQNGTIDAELLEDIKDYLVQGFVRDGGKRYGVAIENIQKIVANPDETPLTAEQVTWLKNNLKTLGIKPKFQTVAEFKKAGYLEEGE